MAKNRAREVRRIDRVLAYCVNRFAIRLHSASFMVVIFSLGLGCFKDASDSIVQFGVEFIIGHLMSETLGQGTREAGNHALLFGEFLVCDLTGVSSGESHDTYYLGMINALLVVVVDRWEGQLEHDFFPVETIQVHKNVGLEQSFTLILFGTRNVDLGFDDWDESSSKNAFGNVKLLVDNCFDTVGICHLDDGTHLGSKDSSLFGTLEELIEGWHGFHELSTMFFGHQALIDLEEGNHVLLFP
mmetsp:Transcript_8021/g.13745  ORF Transcript_8021/g.13745 Transcript_8021/m.13745 type:complete len:243 (+) Transcript_8021:962-1690(+)